MFMLQNNIDNKFSSSKQQSSDRTAMTFIHDQLSFCSKEL